jgi:hypothetical protein
MKLAKRSQSRSLWKLFSLQKSSFSISSHRSLLELDDLIERRSNLSTYEILEKLNSTFDQNKIQLPLRYYQNSIDVCANRGDIESATLVLKLAGESSFHLFIIFSSPFLSSRDQYAN